MKTSSLYFVLSTALVLAMTACSTTPITPKEALREAVMNSHIAVAQITKPAQLSERTKAQALANIVVSNVVSNVAGINAGAVNAQQMQSNMQVIQSFNQSLQQALPSSYIVSAGKGVDLALAKKLSDYLTSQVQSTTPNNRELTIAVNTPLWELAYVSFLSSQDYALNYNLQVSVLEKKDSKLQALTTVSCAKSVKETMPLEKWKADNYKAVDASAKIIVQECFSKFLTETGML
jgi:hypothetical protein